LREECGEGKESFQKWVAENGPLNPDFSDLNAQCMIFEQ
jgi:hypothetical protein